MEKSVMNFIMIPVQSNEPVMILKAQGNLDLFTYSDLIAKAREIYDGGYHSLILDMSEILAVSPQSGLFALHSIGMIFTDQEPLDPKGGWAALRKMAATFSQLDWQNRVKLLRPMPVVQKMLQQLGLQFYSDLTAALAVLPSSRTSQSRAPILSILMRDRPHCKGATAMITGNGKVGYQWFENWASIPGNETSRVAGPCLHFK
jgi:hypothetical protein